MTNELTVEEVAVNPDLTQRSLEVCVTGGQSGVSDRSIQLKPNFINSVSDTVLLKHNPFHSLMKMKSVFLNDLTEHTRERVCDLHSCGPVCDHTPRALQLSEILRADDSLYSARVFRFTNGSDAV